MSRKPALVPPSRQWRVVGRYRRPAATGRPFLCNKLIIAAYPDAAIRKAQQRLGGTIQWVRGPYASPAIVQDF